MNVAVPRLGAAAHPARVVLILAAFLGSQAGCGTTPRRISPGIPSGLRARDAAQEFLDRRRDSFSTVQAGLSGRPRS
jgi:hypothetical protein